MSDYDAIPYDSSAFPETHPENLAALASLFGIDAAEPRRCTVLELGCATGGNLIPMAAHLPASEFFGVELSARQADDAARRAELLNLKNVRIIQGDIVALDLGERRYDFIIAHGLYSWVPDQARRRILEICKAHLSKQGLGYISYNTLPGWRMRGMLRDMLLFYTRDSESAIERLDRAREMLVLVEQLVEGLDALSAQYLREEIRHIRVAHESYLYHEFLSSINEPILFDDFITDLDEHGLAFVCETELHTHFPSRISERADELLSNLPNARQRAQYCDFLVNRNFRQSVICRAECRPLEEPDLERFSGLAFAADLAPPKKSDLRRIKAEPFRSADGTTQQVFHPLTKAAMRLLTDVYPSTVSYPELEAAARRRVVAAGGAPTHVNQTNHLFGELFTLFALRIIRATKEPRTYPRPDLAFPLATAYARAEADSGRLVGVHHSNLEIDRDSRELIARMDGSRGIEQLTSSLDVDRETERPDGGKAPSSHQRDARTRALVELLARQGLLSVACVEGSGESEE